MSPWLWCIASFASFLAASMLSRGLVIPLSTQAVLFIIMWVHNANRQRQ